ncbi:hypothetical protein [Streptomyces zaomyceticus]|uniref:hypothetical protein n=1 Tax=Streptomyces zaomyceticus TaxID=68286 RepID=UPI0036BA02C0
MRLSIASMATAAITMATAGLVVTAPAAQAEGSYNIRVDLKSPLFSASYCLLSTTSGNSRADCENHGYLSNASFRLSVPHNVGDNVWMDINIVAGEDRKPIPLQGKHFITVNGDLAFVKVCGWKSLASYNEGNRGLALHGRSDCFP